MHFTRAAKLLNISQAALSQQIRVLEKKIGVRLLERTNRHVQLTPAGIAFRGRGQAILCETAEAAAEARSIGSSEGGRIIVGYVTTAAMVVLPKILDPFCTRFPGSVVDFRELDPGAQLEALQQNRIDAGFTRVPTSLPSLECRLLTREKLIVALPERHPAVKYRTVDLRNLSEDRFLLPPRHALTGVHEKIINACQKAGFIPKYTESIGLAATAVWLVASGLGIALIPESFKKWKLDGVIYRRLDHDMPVIDLYAIRRKAMASPLLDNLWTNILQRTAKQHDRDVLLATRPCRRTSVAPFRPLH
jgi:DNA-binding transcriptional LysR family regulator